MEEHMDEDGDQGKDEDTELKTLVLGFLQKWPSKHPSSSRIAQAIDRSPREVIDELARLASRGELPVPAVQAPGPVIARSPDPDSGTSTPMPPRWDRAN
jgi:hypothetical protein